MTRRVRLLLALGAGGLVVVAVAVLAVVTLATAAPELPPPPLPTATPPPGPTLPVAPVLPLTPTPTLPAGPPPIPSPVGVAMPTAIAVVPRSSDPNIQLQTSVVAQKTNLAYVDAAYPRDGTPQCDLSGYWTLTVNPQDVIGHPYAAAPGMRDWARAVAAVGLAQAICPVTVRLTWYAHERARPSSDVWMASLPANNAVGIDSPTLRRYALRHAQQV